MEVLGVKESAVQHLRTKIVVGELKPGQKLNEAQLASELGISRPPIREAFRLLEAEHLVVSHPRRGAFVSELSVEDLKQVFEARIMIECYAIDLLRMRKVRKLAAVEAALEATCGLSFPSHGKRDEVLRYLQQVIAFHRKLIEASRNRWIERFYESIHPSLTRYEFIYTYLPDRAGPWRSEHKRILTLIGSGEYDEAKALLKGHIERVAEILSRKISEKSTLSSHEAKAR